MNRFIVNTHRVVFAMAIALGLPAAASAQEVDTVRVIVDGHEMALYVTGRGPTVVMESGGGASHRAWQSVAPQLAQHARVVTYDRPGYGLSAHCDSARTASRIARELRTALQLANIDGPFHVVGWSYGGAIARVFAGAFPRDVMSLVLVDPAPEDFYARAAREQPDAYTREEESYFPDVYGDSTRRAEQKELAGYAASMEQARASDSQHSTRTAVLIAGGQPGSTDPLSPIWMDELQRWASGRPNTVALVIEGSGHHIARDNPAAVVDAVLQMMGAGTRH